MSGRAGFIVLAVSPRYATFLVAACAHSTGARGRFDTEVAYAVKLLPMRPSQALSQHRDAVCLAAARYRVANPRVFGSALRGDDHEGSDLDLLVDPLPGTTLLDLGGLQDELQELLGVSVDVLTLKDLPVKFRDMVRQEARPI